MSTVIKQRDEMVKIMKKNRVIMIKNMKKKHGNCGFFKKRNEQWLKHEGIWHRAKS